MHVKTDKPPSPWMKRTNGRRQVPLPGPGHPAPEDVNNSRSPATEVLQSPDIRPLPQARTSGHSPDIRCPIIERPEAGPRQPGHPARGPDIRLFVSRRTSGPQPGHPAPACAQRTGQGPMYPPSHLPLRGLALYILPHLLLIRVSVDLAHL